MRMNQTQIRRRLRSAQTWARAEWWMQMKSGAEAKEAWGVINPDDYLPIVLGFIKRFVVLVPVSILLWLFWKINIFIFYIMLGISIPLSLGVAYLLDYLIGKYVATEK